MRDPEGWSGTRVLVTGASGFLGRPVAERLRASGAVVIGTSRRAQSPSSQWVRSPMDSAGEVDRVLTATSPDVVLHLAGHVSAAPSPELVQPTFDSLVLSSLALLRAVHDGRLRRLVLVGSTEEPAPGSVPSSPYGAAKATASTYAGLYARWGADVVVTRLAMTYGAGQHPSKLLPHVARAVLRGERPALTSGARLADWVYVDDVVDGLICAAQRAPAGSALDLGTGVLTSTRDVVEHLLAALGTDVRPRWGALPDRPDEPSRAADVHQAEQLIGWRAARTLQDGISRTAAHWLAEPVT